MDAVSQTIAILSLFFLCAIVGLLTRYMRYRETLALIDKGMFIPESPHKANRNMLRWGIILTFVSFPWAFVFVIISIFSGGLTYVDNLAAPGIFLGLMPFFFGLALICISSIERKKIGGVKVEHEDQQPFYKRD